MGELIKLLPEGSGVVAVITTVIIFLRNQKEFNTSLRTISEEFSKNIMSMQEDFHKQRDSLSSAYLESEKSYKNQIQKLFDSFVNVSKETVTALKQSESALRELKEEIRKPQPKEESQ